MPDLQNVKIISPLQIDPGGELGPFPFEFFERACLAQGDSWFSIGAIPPTLTTNILDGLQLQKSTVVVNCARPGKELTHMTDSATEPQFLQQLTGNLARKWDAILISGIGNDAIDAAQSPPTSPVDRRLLLTASERVGDPGDGNAYLNEAGWTVFANHIAVVFDELVRRRNTGVNKSTPMLFHNYSRLQPRPAPAGFGFGPWLQPSFSAFGIPQDAWLAVSDALMDRVDQLLRDLIAKHVALDPSAALHRVNTRSADLVLAALGSTGSSGDFQNEIHPTPAGYTKLAAVWGVAIQALPNW